MCIIVCVYIYIRVRVCVHIYTSIYIYIYAHIHTHIYTHKLYYSSSTPESGIDVVLLLVLPFRNAYQVMSTPRWHTCMRTCTIFPTLQLVHILRRDTNKNHARSDACGFSALHVPRLVDTLRQIHTICTTFVQCTSCKIVDARETVVTCF